MVLDGNWARRWVELAAASMAENRTELIHLDRNIGDGDHGENMDRGFQAALGKLTTLDAEATPADVLKLLATTLISTVGGAAGPSTDLPSSREPSRSRGSLNWRLRTWRRSSKRPPPGSSSAARPSRGTRRWSTRGLPPLPQRARPRKLVKMRWRCFVPPRLPPSKELPQRNPSWPGREGELPG